MEQFEKRFVGSLVGRPRTNDTETDAAIGTPGEDRLYALEPSERS
jgi:hypothetical protein